MSEHEFRAKAIDLITTYVDEHLDKSDEAVGFSVYCVWLSKVLQNNKGLFSTDLSDGMYYEVTYNGDKDELYLDAYKKFENRCYSNN